MWRPLAVVVAVCSVLLVKGLHEDKAGKLDWHKENLGLIQHAAFEGKRAYVATEAGVLAALNVRTGHVEWRRTLPNTPQGTQTASRLAVHAGETLITLTEGGSHVWAWRASDGALLWDTKLSRTPHTSAQMPTPELVVLPSHETSSGLLALVDATGRSTFLSVDQGAVVWEWDADDSNGNTLTAAYGAAYIGDGAVAVVGESHRHVTAHVLWPREERTEVVKDAVAAKDYKLPHGSSSYWSFARTDPHHHHGVASLVSAGGRYKMVTIPSDSQLQAVQGAPTAVFASESGNILHVMASEGGLHLRPVHPGHVSAGQLLAVADAGHVFVGRRGGPVEVEVLRVHDGASVGRLIASPRSPSSHLHSIFPATFDLKAGGHGFRAILVDDRHGTSMVQQANTVWVRQECLASVESVSFIEYIPEHMLEGTGLDKHHLPTLKERLLLQWTHAQRWLHGLVGGKHVHASSSSDPQQVEDVDARAVRFGLSKLAILLTKPGRVVALHMKDGRVAWTHDLTDTTQGARDNKWRAVVTRQAAVMGYLPEVLFLSSDGKAVWLDGITGHVHGESELGSSLELAMPLDIRDNEERRLTLIIRGGDLRGRVIGGPPSTDSKDGTCVDDGGASHLQRHKPTYFHILEKHNGTITAYKVLPPPANSTEGSEDDAWPLGSAQISSASLPDDESVVDVQYPDPADSSASRAHVLGDHGLLLKYLNPHVMVVASTSLTAKAINASTTVTSGPPDVPTVYITLLDTISCRVLHRVSHFYASPPLSLRMVENWAVYSYWNTRAQRTEMGVVSYYDGYIDSHGLSPFTQPEQRDYFSSLDGDTPPPGIQRTYIFPRPIVALGSSTTERGITPKAVLVGYAPGQILSLDRRLLDPRRPGAEPSAAEKAEGLVPYQHYLPILPTHVISYNRTIEGLRAIYTVPSRLESTSLLLGVGLDLWSTRLHPARAFDTLPDDFSRFWVGMILAGLVALTVMLHRRVKAKALAEAWA